MVQHLGRRLSFFDNAMALGGNERVTGTPAIISAALYVRKLPAREQIEALAKNDLRSFDSLAGPPVRGRWQVAGAFEFERHIVYHEASGEAELAAYVRSHAAEPLIAKAAGGPWWDMHCVSTREAHARELIFFRMEHACGDGIALLQVLSRLATNLDGSPLAQVNYRRPPRAGPAPGYCALLWDFARNFFKYARLPMGAFDTQLPVHQPLASRHAGLRFSSRRQTVVVPPHSLAVVKAIKDAAGGGTTVNDVMFAAFAGALRRHALAHDATLALDEGGTLVRALVPLAFPRPPGTPLTNDWTFLSVEVPVGLPQCADRLAAAHETFDRLKGSTEAFASRLATQINALSPPSLLGAVAQQLFSRHTLVFSNVPGPAAAVAVCGEEVRARTRAHARARAHTRVLCTMHVHAHVRSSALAWHAVRADRVPRGLQSVGRLPQS